MQANTLQIHNFYIKRTGASASLPWLLYIYDDAFLKSSKDFIH